MSIPEPWVDDRITLYGLFLEANLRLGQAVSQDIEHETGRSAAEFELLLRIARHGEPPPTMSVLAEGLSFSSGGISRLADRLEREGLVRRRPCTDDGRVTHLELTDDGRRLLRRATPVHLETIQREFVDRLDPRVRSVFEAGLRALRSELPPAGDGAF